MSRRSLLFMPGNNPGMLTTSDVLGADTLVFDLEDAVSLNEKDSARALVKEALKFLHFKHSEVSVRINPVDSPYWQEDLKFIIETIPDSIVIPKASVESVKAIEAEMNRLKVLYGIDKEIRFILIIETAMGLVDIRNIVEASSLTDGLILGAEDLSSDLGIKRTKTNKEIEYARFVLATTAKAYRIDAIDTPYTDIDDFDGLTTDTAFAKSIGFTGRLAINPRQVEILHEVFSPTDFEIEESLAILAEASDAKEKGFGVFSYKGKMVDLPVIKRAETTIASAKKMGANQMMNALGKEGFSNPYIGAFKKVKKSTFISNKTDLTKSPQFYTDLDTVLDHLNLHDDMTVSFHHHLRNGDYVLDLVLRNLQKRGIKDITVAASSIFPCHKIIVDMFEDGTVRKVIASYISGPVAKAISEGRCKDICEITTHGERPRSLLEGDLVVDVAFIAAPAVDKDGNLSGSDGPSACGVLGYAVADAMTAKEVVAITDFTSDTINRPEISHHLIDYVVKVDSIGDPKGIVSGTTMITKDPVGLKIARDAATLIAHSGLLKNGFSFQTGAGGISLAVASEVKKIMAKNQIKGSFACGGTTDYLVNMLKEGFFEKLYDVQCFNLDAVESVKVNENHIKIDANTYANINNPDNIVNKLDVVILGASEIDLDYNVNVTTGSDGVILGGSGGHADTAAGAKLSIIVSQLVNSRLSCLVDKVTTISTPGETIDILVTDRGIAIHPRHSDLIKKLKEETSLEILEIKELKKIADYLTGIPEKKVTSDQVVAIGKYRDGTILDVIYKV